MAAFPLNPKPQTLSTYSMAAFPGRVRRAAGVGPPRLYRAALRRYLTLPYLALPYLTLPYLTLPYLTLPYNVEWIRGQVDVWSAGVMMYISSYNITYSLFLITDVYLQL